MAVTKKSVKKTTKKVPKKKVVVLYSGKGTDQPPFRRKELNPDIEVRDALLKDCFFDLHFSPGQPMQKLRTGTPVYTDSYHARFDNCTAEILERLVEQNFANPTRRQGKAPCTRHFLNFMLAFPEVRAHGIVISDKFSDNDIIFEGLHIPHNVWKTVPTKRRELISREFTKFNRAAVEAGPGAQENAFWSWFDG
jgi:hypothetical protein